MQMRGFLLKSIEQSYVKGESLTIISAYPVLKYLFRQVYMDTSNSIFSSVVPLSRFRAISQGIAIAIVGVGFLVLAGWQFDIELLKSLLHEWPTMKGNTAVLFILSGSLLWFKLRETKRGWGIWGVSVLILLISSLTLGEYFFGADFGIDQLLFKDLLPDSIYPGRMALLTTVSFILLVLAILSINRPSGKPAKEYFILPVFIITFLALIGYLYGVSSLYKFGTYASMAANTAGGLLLLSVGILMAEPERGLVRAIWANTDGGMVLRRFLPVVLIFPAVIGWLRLLGQRLGLYDTAFGLAIMVTTLTTVLTFVVWLNANQLTEIESQRRQAEFDRIENENKYAMLFNKSAVPAAVLKLPEVIIMDVNEAMEKLVGFTKEQLYGRTAIDLGISSLAERKRVIDKHEMRGSISGAEMKIHTKAGEERDVLVNTNVLLLSEVPHAISTMQDISDQKRAEKEIRQLNEDLEERIERRTEELAQANEQLQNLSIRDELTGLYNRRGFLLLAEEQLLLARRAKIKLLIFYADMDGLKQINDQQGHSAGDQALRTVAQILEETFRESDIKARLGGDEFIVMAIEATKPDVSGLLARLQKQLDENNLSMSIGVVNINPRKKINLVELITHADEAMYKVKLQKPRHRQ